MKVDYQVNKVYCADDEVFGDFFIDTKDKIMLYFASIISCENFNNKFNKKPIFLKFCKTKNSYYEYSSKTIFISKNQQTKPTLLHELSHAVCFRYKQPLHGKNFCLRYLWFVKEYLNTDYYEKLKQAFDKYRVDY